MRMSKKAIQEMKDHFAELDRHNKKVQENLEAMAARKQVRATKLSVKFPATVNFTKKLDSVKSHKELLENFDSVMPQVLIELNMAHVMGRVLNVKF